MHNATCRNCGNENVYCHTADSKIVHYDCLDCNYEWSAPAINSGQVLFNLAAGLVGVSLIVVGASSMLTHIHASLSSQSPLVLLIVGMSLVALFAYRSIRTYRFIRK